MKKLIVNNCYDIAEYMYKKSHDKHCNVLFVGLYEDAACVLKELLCFENTAAYNIDLKSEAIDYYDLEFYVSIDEDMNVWCSKAYFREKKIYLYTEADCVLFADDCNYDILDSIGCDDIYEVSYNFEDDDYDDDDYKCEDSCDGNCKCCELDCRPDPEESIGSEKELVSNSSFITTTSHVTVDKDGTIKGFEKTWSSKDGDMTYYSTYSHYGNNQEMIKQLMENFDIKI